MKKKLSHIEFSALYKKAMSGLDRAQKLLFEARDKHEKAVPSRPKKAA